jgi:hypothetical protein
MAAIQATSNVSPSEVPIRRKHVSSEPAGIDKALLSLSEPRRVRNKAHVQFVSKQPCLICGRQPADAHHLRFSQRRALGRKVSDEFTVPLCRTHHRQLHRYTDERSWWQTNGVDPLKIAESLWQRTTGTAHAPSAK